MEITTTTVRFQQNVLIHAIKNTILEAGIRDIEKLKRYLITCIQMEIYSMMNESKFDIRINEVIPFMMLFNSVETSLIVDGEDVRLTCRFNERMNSYVMYIEYENEHINIKCSVIENKLNVEVF